MAGNVLKNLIAREITYLKRISPKVTGKHFICVAQPKTGSTFLTRIVADLVGWDLIHYNDVDENKRSYSLSLFSQVCKKNGVVHLHSAPSPLLIASAISVSTGIVILRRNFIEYCHSLSAHIERGHPTLLKNKLQSLNKYDALKFIAFQEFGWVFRFVEQWGAYSERIIKDDGEKFIKIIDHSELFSNTELIVSECLTHSGFKADEIQINDVIHNTKKDYKKSNFHQTKFDYDEAVEYEFFKEMKKLAPKLFYTIE